MKLHNIGCNWSSPCGAFVLAIIYGKSPYFWTRKILQYRNSHKRYTKEYTRYYGVKYKEDASTCYLTEMLHFLHGIREKKIDLVKRLAIKELAELLNPRKTYVIATHDHFLILRNHRLYDNQWYGKRVEGAHYSDSEVYYIIPLIL